MSNSLEAKIVVLGAQGVGKTSLVQRYVRNSFSEAAPSTVGASFVTKRVLDSTSDTLVRLQIWDTAGQERFRSISRLYYRGAHAGLLCYDITDERSFDEMRGWLLELKHSLPDPDDSSSLVVHVVGTKADVVALDPSRRRVPFERTIAYVAEQLYPSRASTPTPNLANGGESKRNSGFWAQDVGWDCCHEVSSKDGEGIDEVFRVIARKLVEQRTRKEREAEGRQTPARARSRAGRTSADADKRRSWLGFPPLAAPDSPEEEDDLSNLENYQEEAVDLVDHNRTKRCC